MIMRINPDNGIFKSEEYQKDMYKFNLVQKILESEELELYSDEENYFIARGAKNYPAWIWTKDGIDETLIYEIMDALMIFLTDNDKDKFTCKQELYELLKKYNFPYLNDDYFEMGFLSCKKPIKPKHCEGNLDIPSDIDKDTLVEYWINDTNEMNGIDAITREEAIKDVESVLESDTFYVWRVNGKIVCMASYSVVDNQAKINHVYTPPEERKKGYAANLIHDITIALLAEDLVPLLYTDYNYIPSNKAYINVGYEDQGILINFSCSKSREVEDEGIKTGR